jgi:hypothetical protein
MPILGAGLIPSGPIGDELAATVRRAYAVSVVSQIYRQNPLCALLLRNAIRASGGVSPYTQPVQVGTYVDSSWIGPGGQFTVPDDRAGTVNAEFNMTCLATPVVSFGLEQLVTQDAIAVTSRLMLKLNDLKNSAMKSLTSALFGSNQSAPFPALTMFGLLDAYGNTGTYGGLPRATYTDWQGLSIPSLSVAVPGARVNVIQALLNVAQFSGGEAGDFMVMSIQDWTSLMTDFMSVERFNTDPASRYGKDDPVNSGFRGLLLGDTPIFFDLNCPQGTAFIFNSRYITLVLHEDCSFAWSGWYSTIPQGQVASVGLQLTALNLVCSKPKTGAIVTGITGGASFAN